MQTQLNIGTRITFEGPKYPITLTILKKEYTKKGLVLYFFEGPQEMFSLTKNEIKNNTGERYHQLYQKHNKIIDES